ncbi:hypothetical protein CLAVI_000942 [Candidatus Clavichlamydia salmonicola]|uniref:hypothetical protein n=1 Tax=Candidatus Clavichlamydia salmonicola TaxID=469812 RepID=UPI001891E5E1|nr:hypothetical protein [Candidatus Clavichlamydia salmonicola]MBF5051301.1 hypothetical protein [Candidatus Clavichlamydia salmonicola]
MSGIGSGFSSGIQYLNSNFFVHTGRKCPSSWTELKDNISKNMQTCAKICTAFLDSSLGLAVSMGIVGVVTTSLCAGEDMVDVVVTTLFPSITTTATTTTTITTVPASTLIPLSNRELVYLCTQGNKKFLEEDKIASQNWTLDQFGIGQRVGHSLSQHDMYCVSLAAYHNKYPNTSFPEFSAIDWSGYSNSSISKGYFTYVYVEETSSHSGFQLSNLTDCMVKGVFDMLGASDSHFFKKASKAKYKPASMQSLGHINAKDGIDRGAYCWEHNKKMKSHFPKYFPDLTNFNMSKEVTLAPSTTERTLTTAIDNLTTSVTSMSVTTDMSGVDSSCLPCSSMMLAFGVGSALVLTATIAKIIYTHCKRRKRINATVSGNRLGKILTGSMKEWVLLGASEVGCGVLVLSLKDFCEPPSKEAKQMVVISTALYLTSAATRLLGTCITSPVEEDADDEEDLGWLMLEPLASVAVSPDFNV